MYSRSISWAFVLPHLGIMGFLPLGLLSSSNSISVNENSDSQTTLWRYAHRLLFLSSFLLIAEEHHSRLGGFSLIISVSVLITEQRQHRYGLRLVPLPSLQASTRMANSGIIGISLLRLLFSRSILLLRRERGFLGLRLRGIAAAMFTARLRRNQRWWRFGSA